MGVTAFNRTLDQELSALARGASLECLVCGEFVMHARGRICCPECGMTLRRDEPASGSASRRIAIRRFTTCSRRSSALRALSISSFVD